MKFKIIPNEQTPKATKEIQSEFLKVMMVGVYKKFVSFASRQKNCSGLASNQCSCDGFRIEERFFAIKLKGRWDIVINPVIKKTYGKAEEKIEGCLTWMGKKIKAKRYPRILVEYYNIKGEKIIDNVLHGIEAQVWQHEVNHLDGVEEKFENPNP